ncbi:WD repeat, SAM and U-box domain-containing protein 1-like isoform X1 [Paramisgurnus dabryanus]|uniref:WD repeat, SAM and U-box domain-containing protein 1-like isoform X1 n=2 Tax=Paramisgurnus dabryanus TaxID=90735 RepID=UPI0031F3C9B1
MTSLVHTLRDHLDDVNGCTLSQSLLATCSGDKTVRVYSLEDFSELRFSPLTGHGYAVHGCCFSACGRFLASCSTDALTKVWSTSTGAEVAALQHPARSPVRVCAFSPDARHLLSGASDGTVALWHVPSKTLQRCSRVSEGTVLACCFSPCDQMFVTGSTLGELHLWTLTMNSLHIQKVAHDLGVNCCQFSPKICTDGPAVKFRLVSGGQDSQLRVWIITQHASAAGYEMTLMFTLSAQSAPILSCAVSFDGQLLISGSVDKTVTVYNMDRGELLHTLTHHDRYVTTCAFSPSMLMFASGSMDKTVNIWRIEDENSQPSSLQTTGPGRKSVCYSRMLVSDWSEDDVCDWLQDEGLEALVDTFRAQNIDGPELITLNKETLDNHFNIDSVGLRGKVLRKINGLRSELMDSDVPNHFLCPITRELMKDPVIAADGYSYERDAIETWINTPNHLSPVYNLPLKTTLLIPNRSLKTAIQCYKANHPSFDNILFN